MTTQIKLFQSAQKYIRRLGIYPSQPNQSYSFNLKNAFSLSLLILMFIFRIAYFLYEAQTIAEHAQIFYLSVTEMALIVDFVTMCWKIGDILQLIEKFEQFIQKSKLLKFSY